MSSGEVGVAGHVLGRGGEHRKLPAESIAHGEFGRLNAVRSVDGEGTERLPPKSVRQQGVLPGERAWTRTTPTDLEETKWTTTAVITSGPQVDPGLLGQGSGAGREKSS